MIWRYLDSENLETKLWGAAAACQISDLIPERAFELLAVMAMRGTQVDQPKTNEQDVLEMDLSVGAKLTLDAMGEDALERAVECWVTLLPTVEENNVVEYVHRMVAWTLPQAHEQKKTPGFTFSRLHRKVLQVVVDCSRYWSLKRYTICFPAPRSIEGRQMRSYFLSTLYGLPATPEGLRAILVQREE